MNSHLLIKVDGTDMAMRPGQTLDLEDRNPLFNDTEMFSLPFEAPFENNRSLMKNVDDTDSDMRPIELEHKPAIIFAEGLPLRSGVTVVQEDEKLESGMAMNIDASTRSFDDLIGDLECQDVPLKDAIQVGEKIGNVHVEVAYDYKVTMKKGSKSTTTYTVTDDTADGEFEPSVTAFSYPGICKVISAATQEAEENLQKRKVYPKGQMVKVPKERDGYANSTFINVTDAYGENSDHWGAGGAKYCNARVCYKHYGLNDDGTTSDEVETTDNTLYSGDMYEAHGPYWVLDADRPASGLCFYVLYFLDCLFAYLDVTFDKSALMAVEDFKHLCFFSTKVAFETREVQGYPTFTSIDQVNTWLESRGCGGRLELTEPEAKSLQEFEYRNTFQPDTWTKVKAGVDYDTITSEVTSYSVRSFSAQIFAMYATPDNFPDVSVKTILDSLEASFGIRFHYDYERRKVTAYLLRDVFRSNEAPIDFQGSVHTIHKMTEKITGFRQKYSAEGTPKDQAEYIRTGKRDYDTDFDYCEYPEGRVVIDKQFKDFAGSASSREMRVFVDPTTGDAFRVKVNSEATSTSDMKPVWFEVGQFKGIEVGDCSAENEDYVREYISDFQPISFNDVNYSSYINSVSGSIVSVGGGIEARGFQTSGQPLLCAYVDEDMEHEFVTQLISNPLSSVLVDLYLTEKLQMVESYDPSDTDEGESPLQTYDWGLAVAMMRGGGTNMTVQNYDHGYDGFENDRWRTVAGEYALTSDTMDQVGNEFDYNGDASGIGAGERFSLKITAYKPFRYKYVGGQLKISTDPTEWSDASWLVPCNQDEVDQQTSEVTKKIRSRGLFDTFMSEWAYFLLRRKKYLIKASTTVAQLADIPNHWMRRWRIGGKVGYINKVNYQLSVEKSLGEVDIEFYAI